MSALTNFKKKLGEILDKPEGTNPIIDVLIQLEKRTYIPRFLKVTHIDIPGRCRRTLVVLASL